MASPVWRFIDIMLPLIEKGGFYNSNQMGHQLMNLKPPSPTLLSLAGFLFLLHLQGYSGSMKYLTMK